MLGVMAMQSRHPDETNDLVPGVNAASGIYTVSHHAPAHAIPHDVLVPATIILPACNACAGVRFSLRSLSPVPIGEHRFFWPPNHLP
jgi:hypothetical protein